MSIGVFDSGIGGLSVYLKLKEKFPNIKIIYFADLLNFPYGKKTEEEILSFCENISEFLIKKGVKKIVIACNTASSIALEYLKNKFDIEFISIIEPLVKKISKIDNRPYSLIATEGTVRSNFYKKKLKDKLMYQVAAPDLVEVIENLSKDGIKDIIKKYISNDMVNNTELILGCTHFPLVEKYILEVYPSIKLLNPADYLVDEINYLDYDVLSNDIFYTSANIEYFKIQLKNIIGKDDLDVRVYKWNS